MVIYFTDLWYFYLYKFAKSFFYGVRVEDLSYNSIFYKQPSLFCSLCIFRHNNRIYRFFHIRGCSKLFEDHGAGDSRLLYWPGPHAYLIAGDETEPVWYKKPDPGRHSTFLAPGILTWPGNGFYSFRDIFRKRTDKGTSFLSAFKTGPLVCMAGFCYRYRCKDII